VPIHHWFITKPSRHRIVQVKLSIVNASLEYAVGSDASWGRAGEIADGRRQIGCALGTYPRAAADSLPRYGSTNHVGGQVRG
jgi:hypothetical protein